MASDDRAGVLGDVAGAITRAVVDDKHGRRAATHFARELLKHDADVLSLVVGGHEDRDLPSEMGGVTIAAKTLPGEAFEHRLEPR